MHQYAHTTNPTRQPRRHHSAQSSPYLQAQSSPPILPQHEDYIAHTHGLVSTLPPDNYTRASLNIPDLIFIGILTTALNATIKAYLTSIAHHQTTKNQCNYSSAKKTSNIITLYYDKAKLNLLLKNSLNALEISDKPTLSQLYYQAWKLISI